ncbi:phage tail sheath family protein [Calothrix sp. FACHB-1219]|uniref:phage tail sheath family protein n=1 Tax=unclassified Calothrix TaxID=2619626 RepID=UPI001683CAFF|nr:MULTISPECIES: phage tail sheath C-terminal domain-containing protein [unclassified Calothrix]MBD2207019.1 phage tail sheath family protein [Calothrix sp. FACHB-168]MBD2221635.1 phage tail sheath family protein [Calothrix sp. FACHB-1219]
MPEYLTPGVYFEFQDAAPPIIRQVRMDIAGFVGLAERGLVNQAVQVNSWRQFQAIFGNFLPYSFLAYAVKGFFENGGRTCFIVRIAGNDAAKASLVLKSNNNTDVLRVTAVNEGSWGNKIAIALTQVRPSSLSFSLTVIRQQQREVFTNLSLNPEHSRYFARLINYGDKKITASQCIYAEDLIAPGVERNQQLLPNATNSGFKNQIGFLAEGKDGVASLTINDFLGKSDPSSPKRQGLSVLETVDAVGIVCIPDIHIRPVLVPELPPVYEPPRDPCLPFPESPTEAIPSISDVLETPPLFSPENIFTVQQAMIEHCERQKDRVAILDAVLRVGSKASLTIAEILEWRSRFDSQRGFAAFYYPWVRVVDPLKLSNNPTKTVPPCGHIAGLYARFDLNLGVYKAPANGELFWAEDVTVEINDDEQAILNPEGVNCVRAFPGRGIRVYGARTISSDPDWRYINVRRLMLQIEEGIDESTQWAVFEPNSFNLRQLIVLGISSFLETFWRQGALVGATPAAAYYVKCDETNNPPEIVNEGKLIVEIGVAPTRPAEFIIFRIGRTVEELEIVER